MSVNKIILLGYVGSDPEMRYPERGFAVARFSLATSEPKGAGGTEVTDWHTCILTGRNAEIAERYVRKGVRLYVEGKMRYREYEDRYKIKRRVAEVEVTSFELLGSPAGSQSSASSGSASGQTSNPTSGPAAGSAPTAL